MVNTFYNLCIVGAFLTPGWKYRLCFSYLFFLFVGVVAKLWCFFFLSSPVSSYASWSFREKSRPALSVMFTKKWMLSAVNWWNKPHARLEYKITVTGTPTNQLNVSTNVVQCLYWRTVGFLTNQSVRFISAAVTQLYFVCTTFIWESRNVFRKKKFHLFSSLVLFLNYNSAFVSCNCSSWRSKQCYVQRLVMHAGYL